MQKYKDACGYCSKVLIDKKRALQMLGEAEKLSQVATDYKCTNKFDKSLLAPQLTPEILFGISKEEKAQKFQELLDDLDLRMKEESAKAKRWPEGSKQVNKAQEQQNQRAIAAKCIEAVKAIKGEMAELKAQ